MKRFSWAMLGLTLVFVAAALAFVGCSNGTTDAPKTVEGLFDEMGTAG